MLGPGKDCALATGAWGRQMPASHRSLPRGLSSEEGMGLGGGAGQGVVPGREVS